MIAIQVEEPNLIGLFGDPYRLYRQRVGMLPPLPMRRSSGWMENRRAPERSSV